MTTKRAPGPPRRSSSRKKVTDYELLPYHRGYGFLGRVYEMKEFTSPSPETLKRLGAIIDEAFGRGGAPIKA
jgi:hypothetical protein